MRNHAPTTERINASEVRQQWGEILDRVYRKEARVVIEKSGIPVAVVVSTDDMERLARLEHERSKDFKVIDEMREAFKGVSEDEIERETDRAIAEVRRHRTG